VALQHMTSDSARSQSRHSALSSRDDTDVIGISLRISFHGGESVLGCGAGSGILAMVALRLGAASALEWNATLLRWMCTRLCHRETGFGDNLEFRGGTLEEVDRQGDAAADLVSRLNSDRQTLLLLCDELAQYVSHGGALCCPAFLLESAKMSEAFSKVGAMLSQRREQQTAVGLELLMVESCEVSKCVDRDRTTT